MICHVAHQDAVLCDGRALERVKRPARIVDVDTAGRRAAWMVASGHRIELHEAKDGRIVIRRRVSGAEVAVTARGDLAWAGTRVVVKPAGGVARDLGRGSAVAFEDGRTLRIDEDRDTHYVDLRPPAIRDGCPRRERFEPIAATPDVLVTKAAYGPEDSGWEVIRACLRGSGRDHVLDATDADEDFSGADDNGVAGISGRWVVLFNVGSLKDLWGGTISTFDAGTGRLARHAMVPDAGIDGLPDDGATVATAAGVPVWVSSGHVVTIGAGGRLAILDSGTAITQLQTDGTTVSWLTDGQPRSASPR